MLPLRSSVNAFADVKLESGLCSLFTAETASTDGGLTFIGGTSGFLLSSHVFFIGRFVNDFFVKVATVQELFFFCALSLTNWESGARLI